MQAINYNIITQKIKNLAPTFGFLGASIASIKIDDNTQTRFVEWLNTVDYGDMKYLAKNVNLRFNPRELVNGTLSIICVKIPYLTSSVKSHKARLDNLENAYISNYALGDDYHLVVKQQLRLYAAAINQLITDEGLSELKYRAFTDSAPILEVEMAASSGLGFRGKNTLLLNTREGSFFFLGELFTNLPLITDNKTSSHCGSCTKCLDICPTKAFISPYQLDATKCISYLTIENKGSIPTKYRKMIGNRIYGCDDCQLFCPWNKFAKKATLPTFNPQNDLENLNLVDAFNLNENEWLTKVKNTPIVRIGYLSWLRNVAVALGNAPTSVAIIEALSKHKEHSSPLVREHVLWALAQHQKKVNYV